MGGVFSFDVRVHHSSFLFVADHCTFFFGFVLDCFFLDLTLHPLASSFQANEKNKNTKKIKI